MNAALDAPHAIVPVAGLGTRLLPATKSQPKEMLPVAGRPVVQHVVEELAGAGVRRILFVTGRGKNSIEDHFDGDADLVRMLRESGREELLAELAYERMGVEFLYTRQREQRGLADAVLCGEALSHSSPFVLALGDSIVGRRGRSQTVARMIEAFRQTGAACVVAVQTVPERDAHRYGIVTPAPGTDDGERLLAVAALTEKPQPDERAGNLAVAARYVLAPAIFAAIRETPPGAQGEVQLTDAIAALLRQGLPVYAMRLPEGERRYDAGTLEGYSATFLEFALDDPRFGDRLRRRAQELLDEAGQG